MNQETDISRYLHMIDVCKTVAKLDKEWQRGDVGHDDARYTPWMPNPSWPDYVALLAEAMPDVEGPRFLEVGCGIGTRMLIAREMFGLDVSGIERVPEYVAQAKELGLSVECTDALGWEGYGTFDVVWLNRPFRDPEMDNWRSSGLLTRGWKHRAGSNPASGAKSGYPPRQRGGT